MKNRGSNPILTNLVGVHPRNIHTNLKQIRAAVRKKNSIKTKKVYAAADNNNDDGHRVIARVTLTR